MDLSIIVPLYNEEPNVDRLYHAIRSAIDPLGLTYEIVMVDDGSTDRTAEKARDIAACDERLTFVRFRRNYGQTPAMAAGIEIARGEILVTIDGDLQNDPRDIPLFLDKIRDGYNLVVGWRVNRQDNAITRKLPSKVANWLIGKVTGVPIKDNGCSLKAYEASVFKHIPLYAEMHRFIPAISSFAGIRLAEIPVRHHAREFGDSKYGLSRIYKVLLDLITVRTLISSMRNPLTYFTVVAAVPFFAGLALLIHQTAYWLSHGNFAFMFIGTSTLLLFTSVNLLLWGVVASMLIQTGDARKRRLTRLTSSRVGRELA